MATSIDDNATDENLYKLFGEMSVIQYTSIPHKKWIRSSNNDIKWTEFFDFIIR